MCARARARPAEPDGVPGAPSIARSSRGPAAPPPARPGPAPGPSPAAPHGAVSHRRAGVCGGEHPEEARAEGEAARGRLPRRGEVASCSPAPPPSGSGPGPVRKVVRGAPGDHPAPLGPPHSPLPTLPAAAAAGAEGRPELKLLPRDAGASEAIWDGEVDGTGASQLHAAPLSSEEGLKLTLRKQLASVFSAQVSLELAPLDFSVPSPLKKLAAELWRKKKKNLPWSLKFPAWTLTFPIPTPALLRGTPFFSSPNTPLPHRPAGCRSGAGATVVGASSRLLPLCQGLPVLP